MQLIVSISRQKKDPEGSFGSVVVINTSIGQVLMHWTCIHNFAIRNTTIGLVAGVLSTENCTALLLSLLDVLKNRHGISSTVP